MKKLLLALLLLPAPLLGQEELSSETSIVDIARQSRARRARVSNPPIIITNANLKNFRTMMNRPALPTPAKSRETLREERDARTWSSLFERAKGHLESMLERSLYLQEKMTALSNGWVPVIDGRIEGTVEEQLQETQQALKDNQQELEAAKRLLDDLQKQARRAGIPAGAIRKMVGQTPESP